MPWNCTLEITAATTRFVHIKYTHICNARRNTTHGRSVVVSHCRHRSARCMLTHAAPVGSKMSICQALNAAHRHEMCTCVLAKEKKYRKNTHTHTQPTECTQNTNRSISAHPHICVKQTNAYTHMAAFFYIHTRTLIRDKFLCVCVCVLCTMEARVCEL